MKVLAILLVMIAGCTCAHYREHSNTGSDVIKKSIYYCSTKDIRGLKVQQGGSSITLNNAENNAGEAIKDLNKIKPF